MKHLSFRILFLCIFLPPILYIFSIQALELLIQRQWSADLRRALLSDTSSILAGNIRIQDQLQQNIDSYLAASRILKWGVVPRISVTTSAGRVLYPRPGQENLFSLNAGELSPEQPSANPLEFLQIAKENLKVINEGLNLSVIAQIPRNTWLANTILAFYIFLATCILYYVYRARTRETERLALRNQQELEAATARLASAEATVQQLSEKERKYQKKLQELQATAAMANNKIKAVEDEALMEMERFEEKLLENISSREQMETEVFQLRQELEQLQSGAKTSPRKQDKQVRASSKRFRTLYKNIEFDSRAVQGFVKLQADLQLKVEELIHTMNEDSGRLAVKRKVFAKKGALPVFESEFAYRGRIYWKRAEDGKVHVLAIGTKNTQSKDLAYLERLQWES
jgi:hypothetical protein